MQEKEETSGFRDIIKSTSLFGSIEVFNMGMAVVRSKAAAVLIGVSGVGIVSLVVSSLNLITALTGFGLERGGVQFVAAAKSSGEVALSRTVKIVRRLAWCTGTFGAVLTFLMAGWISSLTFGSGDYTLFYQWLSIAVLFKQLTASEMVFLQGLRKLKSLALVNFCGTLAGLLSTIPLYYFFGISGVVPSIIIAGIFMFIVAFFTNRGIGNKNTNLPPGSFFNEGSDVMKLGLALSATTLFSLLVTFLSQLFVLHDSDTKTVGLFNAGFTMLHSYVGAIFTAMATDYYPKLVSGFGDRQLSTQRMHKQMNGGVLILTPIIAFLLIFSEWIVALLFSKEFSAAATMVNVGLLGILFRVVAWSQDYWLLAAGKSRTYFGLMSGLNLLLLIFNIIGFRFFGLVGLGLAFVLENIIHAIVISLLLRNYHKEYVLGNLIQLGICLVFCVSIYFCGFFINPNLRVTAQAALLILACVFCGVRLFRRR